MGVSQIRLGQTASSRFTNVSCIVMVHAAPPLEIFGEELQRSAVAAVDLDLLASQIVDDEMVRRPGEEFVWSRQALGGWKKVDLARHLDIRRRGCGRWLFDNIYLTRSFIHFDVCPVVRWSCSAVRHAALLLLEASK